MDIDSKRSLWGVVALAVALFGAACGNDPAPSGPEPVTVKGKVTLAGAEEPASGVTVSLEDRETKTSSDGTYSFLNVVPGKTVLTAEKEGYVSYSKQLEVTEGGPFEHNFKIERENQGPSIEAVVVDPTEIEPGEEASVEVVAQDPDGDELNYSYKATGDFSVEKNDDGATAVLTAPDSFGASGSLTVTVSDGRDGEAVETVEVSTVGNTGPSIVDLSAMPTELAPGGSSVLKVGVSDADMDQIDIKWSAPDGWALSGAEQVQAQVQAPEEFGVEATINVKVTDPYGESDSAEVTLRTTENSEPMIVGVEATPPQVEPGATTMLKVEARDADEQSLDVQWNGPNDWTIAAPKVSTTEVTAPGDYGETATFNVTVTDPEGATASSAVRVSTTTNDGPRVDSFDVQPTTVDKGGTVVATVSASDPNGDALSYNWTTSKGWTLNSTSGGGRKAFIRAPAKPAEAGVVEVEISDGSGAKTIASQSVSTRPNRAPSVDQLVANTQQVAKDGTTGIAAVASDPDGDPLTYKWQASQGWTINGSGPNVTVQAPDSYSANGTISLTVTDGFGGSAGSQLLLRTVQNQGPTVQSFVVNPQTVARSGSISAEVIAQDPNGDSLSYNWSMSSSKGWSVSGSGSTATVTAPDIPSSRAVLKVVVDDGNGQTNTATKIVETEANKPPVFTNPSQDLKLSDSANPSPVSHSRSFEFEFNADDPDGDSLTYSLVGSMQNASIDRKNGTMTWTPPESQQGQLKTVKVEVTDTYDTVQRFVELKVGSFDLERSGPTNLSKHDGMDFGDFDADGYTDVVYLNRSGSNSADIEVAYGSKSGFDSNTKTFTWDNNADRCGTPAVGDVDGKNGVDILVVCDRGHSGDNNDFSYYVWKNDGTGKFTKGERHYWGLNDAHWVGDVELADLDGDKDLDAVAVGNETVVVAENDGTGSFRDRDYINHNRWNKYEVEVSNIDQSGRPELVVSARDGDYWGYERRGRMAWWDIRSSVQLGSRHQFDDIGRGREHPTEMEMHDLDGDGDEDIVVLEDRSNRIMMWENQGGGNFNRRVDNAFVSSPAHNEESRAISFGDLDGDGNVDIVTGSQRNREFNIYWGNGAIGYTGRTDINLDSSSFSGDVYGVHVTQWNGDADEDVIFATENGRVGVAY